MDIHQLSEHPPWEWPADAQLQILGVMRNGEAPEDDRLLAVELAGDPTVINDELARELSSLLLSPHETEALRAEAAISLGPALEEAEMEAWDEDEPAPVSPAVIDEARKALQQAYVDPEVPKLVRRKALEGSIRADEEWHWGAVRAAYYDGDSEWRLTAVFCMRYLPGFAREILEALDSEDENIAYQAMRAAGEQEVEEAWSHVEGILLDAVDAEMDPSAVPEETDHSLLMAAMDAAALIRPHEAGNILVDLSDSEDEEIAEAALDAMNMAEVWADVEEDRAQEDPPTFH